MQHLAPVKVFKKKLSACALLGFLGCMVALPCYSSGAIASQQTNHNKASTSSSKDKTRQLIRTLRLQLMQNPQNSLIRMKLAALYYREQAYSDAERELKRVLADDKLPKKMRVKGEKYLANVQRKLQKSKPKKHDLRGGVKAFVGSDSNANVAPDDTVLEGGRELSESSTSKGDEYGGASIFLTHQYRLGSTTNEPKSTQMFWKSGVNAIYKDYSVQDRSDLTVTSLYTGFGLKQSKRWRAGIRLKTTHMGLGGSDLLDLHSIEPTYTQLFDKLSLTIKAFYTRKEYVESADSNKNGTQAGGGVFLSWPVLDGTSLRVGAEVKNSDYNEDWRSYDSVRYSLRLNKKINSAFSMSLSIINEISQFAALEKYYPSDYREDDALATTLGMKYKFSNNLYFGLKHLYTERDSNHDIHSFDRNRLEAFLGYSF